MQKKIDFFKILKCTSTLKFFTIILFNKRVHYKYSYNILSISNFLIKFYGSISMILRNIFT